MSVLRPAEGGLLWRTAKADVLDEIKLPQQTHRMTYLTLNAIERHFYMAQHKVHKLNSSSAARSDAEMKLGRRNSAMGPCCPT